MVKPALAPEASSGFISFLYFALALICSGCTSLNSIDALESRLYSAAPEKARSILSVSVEDLASLTDIGARYTNLLKLSPDGRYAVFQTITGSIESNSHKTAWRLVDLENNNTVTVIGDGGRPIPLMQPFGFPNGNFIAIEPKWAPDSRKVAFRFRDRTGIMLAVYEIGARDIRIIPIVNGNVESFAWDEDGIGLFVQVSKSDTEKHRLDLEEGRRGYLFSEYFVPYVGLRPFWYRCGPSVFPRPKNEYRLCEQALWYVSVNGAEVRRATEQEVTAYSPFGDRLSAFHGDNRRIGRIFRSRHSAALAWTEDLSPGEGNPWIRNYQLFYSLHGDSLSPRSCKSPVCKGAFKDVFWLKSSHEILLLKSRGVARSEFGVYVYDTASGSTRTILESEDLFESCGLVEERLICIHESVTQPARIVSIDIGNGEVTSVYDPNPQFAHKAYPRIEKYEIEDAFGNPAFGHLVYPLEYEQGRRYPLVVVQYGSRGFLRGGTGDEYPILPLSAKGFFVLRFDRPFDWIYEGDVQASAFDYEIREWTDLYELRRATTALTSLIEMLTTKVAIDTDRIGITGLSDGASTLYFSLFETDLFAAASVSSPIWTKSSYFMMGLSGWRDYMNHVGLGRPGGPNDVLWDEMSLAANLEKVKAPLLINAAEHELLLGGLENYITLHEAGKPVEMFVYPDEYHLKSGPAHRYNIYRRNIHWFQFWLQDEESDDPVDPDQYSRWRKLRVQHETNLAKQGSSSRPER